MNDAVWVDEKRHARLLFKRMKQPRGPNDEAAAGPQHALEARGDLRNIILARGISATARKNMVWFEPPWNGVVTHAVDVGETSE